MALPWHVYDTYVEGLEEEFSDEEHPRPAPGPPLSLHELPITVEQG